MHTAIHTTSRTTGIFLRAIRWSAIALGTLPLLGGAATSVEAAEAAATTTSPSPWFIEVAAGVSIVPGGDIRVGGLDYEAEYDNGMVLRAAAGRRLAENWTAALEWSYRTNEAESFTSDETVIAGGDLASTNLFLNLNYTFDERFSLIGFRPYLGAGIGWMQEVDIDLEGFGAEEFSEEWSFAWQWTVGVGRSVGRSGWLFVEGRAVSGGELDLPSSTQDRELTFDYDAWTLLAGMRWAF